METSTKTLILRYCADDDLSPQVLSSMIGVKVQNISRAIKQLIQERKIKHVGWVSHPAKGKPGKLYSSIMYKKAASHYVRITHSERFKRYKTKNQAIIESRKKPRGPFDL
jgi:hypothetical protein